MTYHCTICDRPITKEAHAPTREELDRGKKASAGDHDSARHVALAYKEVR